MKRIAAILVILTMLLSLAVSAAAEDADEVDENGFELRIRNRSNIEFTYLRFDFYLGEDPAAMILSCPNEGEDFYRIPYFAEDPETFSELRIEASYGISDLAPEDALLQAMMGNFAEEHPLLTLDFILEAGCVYELALTQNEEGEWQLIPAEEATPAE